MNAYKVEFRQLLDGKFELYRSEYYTSKAKALACVDDVLEINSAYCVNDTNLWSRENIRIVDYNSNAVSSGECVRLRMCVNKIELR